MSDSDYTTDQSTLTFSQAAGIDPLPQPAKLGELPSTARNALWSRIYLWIRASRVMHFGESNERLGEPWDAILYDYHVSGLNRPGDEFDSGLHIHFPALKKLFLDQDYNSIFDLVLFVMRHELAPNGFGEFVATTLQKCLCAYSLTTIDGVWTIMPTAIPEQRISVEKALRVLTNGPFGGAREHLRKSVDCINTGDYSGSVRESIHAVESVARRLDSNARTLSGALASLAERGLVLHGRVQERDQAIIRLCKR